MAHNGEMRHGYILRKSNFSSWRVPGRCDGGKNMASTADRWLGDGADAHRHRRPDERRSWRSRKRWLFSMASNTSSLSCGLVGMHLQLLLSHMVLILTEYARLGL